MRNATYGVFGVGGYGREVINQIRMGSTGTDRKNPVFVDDHAHGKTVNGYTVKSFEEFQRLDDTSKSLVIAISDHEVRRKIANRCTLAQIAIYSTVASNALIMNDVVMGEGAIVSPFVTITANVRIGTHFQANIYSYVAHDCVIGDFVTFGPRVSCNGNVVIEDNAYVGTGALLKQGTANIPLRIGRGAIVGMGAVVTRDVPAGMVVVGNPARPLSQKPPSD